MTTRRIIGYEGFNDDPSNIYATAASPVAPGEAAFTAFVAFQISEIPTAEAVLFSSGTAGQTDGWSFRAAASGDDVLLQFETIRTGPAARNAEILVLGPDAIGRTILACGTLNTGTPNQILYANGGLVHNVTNAGAIIPSTEPLRLGGDETANGTTFRIFAAGYIGGTEATQGQVEQVFRTYRRTGLLQQSGGALTFDFVYDFFDVRRPVSPAPGTLPNRGTGADGDLVHQGGANVLSGAVDVDPDWVGFFNGVPV